MIINLMFVLPTIKTNIKYLIIIAFHIVTIC